MHEHSVVHFFIIVSNTYREVVWASMNSTTQGSSPSSSHGTYNNLNGKITFKIGGIPPGAQALDFGMAPGKSSLVYYEISTYALACNVGWIYNRDYTTLDEER